MTPLQSSIWSFIADRYVGEENALRRETILARYNLLHGSNLDDRVFRDVVSTLVKVYKKAICSHPAKGYWVARDVHDKQAALNYLDSVLTELGERRRDLAEADPQNRQERLL